jgi:hypothetical protein
MNLMMWIARSAGLACARFTALFQHTSKVRDSIQLIRANATRGLTCGYVNVLDASGTLRARALKGAHAAPLTRRAQRVALVIGIALCLPMGTANSGSIKPYTSLKQLADYQLTHKQYKCHNEIVYRESRFKHDAVNGSHYGYYQIRSKSLHKAPYDYQFYRYWSYVLHRYGYTEYDEPDYCKALHHLKTKGWQ